mmetsp:Transcript_11063/g.16810  ORF Transcript_11063/g.16810 Transcript_11063/m.16810 type:complete len:131 (+) Transcript_11063:667-1059(+)
MEDVTGFNQKSQDYDGEKLVEQGIRKLRERFGEHACNTLALMLKFYEKDRPSFIELHRYMLQFTEFSQFEVENPIKQPGDQADSGALQVQSRPMVNRTNSPQDQLSNGGNPSQFTQGNIDGGAAGPRGLN